jgi:hypothetical protein
MAMILPKGIVRNAPEVEGSIERIDAEPVDPADIAKLWKGILVKSLQYGGEHSNI